MLDMIFVNCTSVFNVFDVFTYVWVDIYYLSKEEKR